MKTKKIQKQLQKDQKRAAHERLGAVALAIATVIGMISVEHAGRNYQRETVVKSSYAFAANSGRENETTRMPVKYDDVLRLQTIGGN